MEEAVDLVVAHGLHRVARQAGQLGVAVPAPHVRQVVRPMVTQHDLLTLDAGRVPDVAHTVQRDHGQRCYPVRGLLLCSWASIAVDSMRRWAETAEAVRATRRTSEKVRLVAEYLRDLDDADLAAAAVFLSGRPFPERDQRKIGLGWAAISAVALAGRWQRRGRPRRRLRPLLGPGHGGGRAARRGWAPARSIGRPARARGGRTGASTALAEARGNERHATPSWPGCSRARTRSSPVI